MSNVPKLNLRHMTKPRRCAQRGLSLVELMVSSALSLVVLASVISVFLSGQLNSQQRSIDLMVSQNLASNMQILVEDIQRAGYQGMYTATLPSSTDIVEIAPDGSWLAFTMFNPASNDYDNIKYIYKNENLAFCRNKDVAILPATSITACKRLFDHDHIRITNFSVTQDTAASSSTTAERLTVSLTGESRVDSAVNYKLDRQIFVRNAK